MTVLSFYVCCFHGLDTPAPPCGAPLYGEESDIAHGTNTDIFLFFYLMFFIVISMALYVLWLWFIPLSIRAVGVRRGQKHALLLAANGQGSECCKEGNGSNWFFHGFYYTVFLLFCELYISCNMLAQSDIHNQIMLVSMTLS